MPFQTRAIEGGRILLVRATGEAVREDWMRLIEHPALGAAGGPSLLIDLRRRTTLPSSGAVRGIGEDLSVVAERVDRVALVARPGAQYGLTRIVYAMAENAGVRIRSFHHASEGLAWLRSGHAGSG